MTKKQILFIAITIIFFATVSYFVWDMAQQTTKPWGKNKKVEVKN
jgi:FlaG/FlaF family flagellin (archaellin)